MSNDKLVKNANKRNEEDNPKNSCKTYIKSGYALSY